MNYHLAIDIGASGGRHMLGSIQNGKLQMEEIYRFENKLIIDSSSLVWDIESLVDNVKEGIRKCKTFGKIPKTIAIDSFGVDYVLLDENGREILPVYSYRDKRTRDVVNEVESIISREELFARTGIQRKNFNTIYQLYCEKKSGKLNKAHHFLMLPSYLSYKLTGKISNEYTNATTTGLVNALSKNWDTDIIDLLGYPKKLFTQLFAPCTKIGNFTDEMREYAGFDASVIYCASHDTASAVAACPLEENSVYISSGTWSLIGIENKQPLLTDEAQKQNFTNEGGINNKYRFLKNYMGMWLLQNIKGNLNDAFDYDGIMQMAEQSNKFKYIDVNSHMFVAPTNMIEAVRQYLQDENTFLADVINSVYHSLAKSYKEALNEIERICGKDFEHIHIVGGGSSDMYLNRLTALYTGKKVITGPAEATALGNIIAQLIYSGECGGLIEARALVKASFNIKEIKA